MFATSAEAGNLRFVDIGSFPIGAKPAGIAVVDLNHDGRLDVLAAHDYVAHVAVVLGTGSLQFASPVVYPSAPSAGGSHHPQPLAIGDFNRDGNVDYVVTSQYGGPFYVSVGIGTGNGQFLAPVSYQVGTCPTSVSAVDTNHDGILDLVVNNSEGHDISVLLGNSNGTFQARTNYAASAWPISNIAADFNGDGHVDVAMVDWNSSALTVLNGSGLGAFGAPTAFSVGENPRSLASGDFNRDGNIDIAVANGEGRSLSVLQGYGDATFAPAVVYPISDGGWGSSEPNSIIAVDLDRDGNLDLAIADFRRGAIEVFRGNPNGIFDAAWVMPVGVTPSTIAAADFNKDGSPDLALLHYDTGRFSVLLNDGVFVGSFE